MPPKTAHTLYFPSPPVLPPVLLRRFPVVDTWLSLTMTFGTLYTRPVCHVLSSMGLCMHSWRVLTHRRSLTLAPRPSWPWQKRQTFLSNSSPSHPPKTRPSSTASSTLLARFPPLSLPTASFSPSASPSLSTVRLPPPPIVPSRLTKSLTLCSHIPNPHHDHPPGLHKRGLRLHSSMDVLCQLRDSSFPRRMVQPAYRAQPLRPR